MVLASGGGAVAAGNVKLVDKVVGDGFGEGDREREMRLMRS